MENNLPSILGGMAQGFTDFGKGLVDMFGTGGASVLDLIESAKTGNVTNRRQDDFRKWLYQTDSTKDAAAKGLGTALNGVQTVADYIPGVNALTQTTLGNAAQGALGGLADELKTYGEDYDLGRAGQRAAISAAGAVASGGLADALKGSNNALLSSNTVRGLARGATGGAISGGGYAAIDGGDVLEAAKQGAGMGALIGGATGAFQDFAPRKSTYSAAMTDEQRQARIANIDDQLSKLDTSTPEGSARYDELMNARDNYLPTARALEATLADADMAVNNPKLTPEQEAYFKDSVMRDSNGNLMPVYHSSPNKFTEFDDARLGDNTAYDNTAFGHFVTNDRDFSSRFRDIDNRGIDGYTMELYANVKNPITHPYMASGKYQDADLDNIVKRYYEAIDNPEGLAAMKDWADESGQSLYEAYMDMTLDENPFDNAAAERDLLRNKGYDAVEFVEGLKDELVDGSTDKTPVSSYAIFRGNQLKDINNLQPTSDVDIMASRMTPEELDLARALANQDLSVNSAKIAPGQLGLFDDMPTQTPKTGTRQTSLFDQPQEDLDYYGSDIEMPIPENGLISRDIEDLTQVPIDANTLPKGWLKARELADMGKRAKQIVLDPNAPNRALNEYNMALYSDAQYGRNNPVADIIDRLGSRQLSNEIDRGAARLLADQLDESGDEFAKNFVTGAAEVGGNIGHYKDAPKARLADQRVSELLNIGRSNSMLSDSLAKPTSRNALGDQWKGTINIKGNDLSSGGDDASSVLWHERMHAFQDAEKMGYDKRVVDAYNDLREDLAKLQHDNKQILRDHGEDAKYWGKPIEQEARMAQHYLDSNYGVDNLSKVYARDSKGKIIRVDDNGQELDPSTLHYYTGKPVRRTEYAAEDKQIKAAFDKFIGKLQGLSRQGVALPALAALFGGGAYMASQENDKDKEVK